jgi:hypothetical protein
VLFHCFHRSRVQMVERRADSWDPTRDWSHRARNCRFKCPFGTPEETLGKVGGGVQPRPRPSRLSARGCRSLARPLRRCVDFRVDTLRKVVFAANVRRLGQQRRASGRFSTSGANGLGRWPGSVRPASLSCWAFMSASYDCSGSGPRFGRLFWVGRPRSGGTAQQMALFLMLLEIRAPL